MKINQKSERKKENNKKRQFKLKKSFAKVNHLEILKKVRAII